MKYLYYTADVFTDQLFSGNPLAIFPNPATDQITIDYHEPGKPTVHLFNAVGQHIRQAVMTTRPFVLEIGDLEKGNYFISIENAKGEKQPGYFIKQ